MSRGLFALVVQLLICVATAFLGIWPLMRPKNFQGFVRENFGILPPVKPGIRPTPIIIRLSSIYLLWYSYFLASAYWAEISALAHIVARLVGKAWAAQ
ncbi:MULTISPECIES: hypothetical protein [unclassified Rhizobium]|uniref:hypothetical protein n=1 Tax=unclassified Rhizobium TaxID=2613769 RepID=UPI00382DF07E